jgi:sugar/nucleoside kinase (ribokinase family)
MKLGGRGCFVSTRDGSARVGAYPVKAVDTTGAGDCFAGAFLTALARGMHPFEAGQVANAVGALTVERMGSTTGLRSWEETVAWMAAVGRS